MAVRGGSDTKGEVWFTGTIDEECRDETIDGDITTTDKANADILANPTDYTVVMNGTTLQYFEGDVVAFVDIPSAEFTKMLVLEELDGDIIAEVTLKCPTDITTVEVTVAHK